MVNRIVFDGQRTVPAGVVDSSLKLGKTFSAACTPIYMRLPFLRSPPPASGLMQYSASINRDVLHQPLNAVRLAAFLIRRERQNQIARRDEILRASSAGTP